MSKEFKKFTSIGKFADAWLQMQRQEIDTLTFRSKIKLHGTNAGVRIQDGEVAYQKRTGDVTLTSDNAGFASWASTVDWITDTDCVIYGEWAGPGVQKSDAICLIPEKMFFVYAVVQGDYMITEPGLIRAMVPVHDRIKVLPWFDEPTTVSNVDEAKAFAETLDKKVQAIGDEDPYVKEMFDISGAGEGLVVCPYVDAITTTESWLYNTFVFKVKSEAHLVQKTKSPNASVYIEIPGSVFEFCDQFVTDNRCEQMVTEHLDGSYAPQGIATFLKVLQQDIIKESKNEFAELGVDWKMVSKEISKRAVKWMKEKHSV